MDPAPDPTWKKNSNFFSSDYPQNYLLYINIENINLPEKKFLITIFYVSTVKSNQVFVICDFSMKIENKKSPKWNWSGRNRIRNTDIKSICAFPI